MSPAAQAHTNRPPPIGGRVRTGPLLRSIAPVPSTSDTERLPSCPSWHTALMAHQSRPNDIDAAQERNMPPTTATQIRADLWQRIAQDVAGAPLTYVILLRHPG